VVEEWLLAVGWFLDVGWVGLGEAEARLNPDVGAEAVQRQLRVHGYKYGQLCNMPPHLLKTPRNTSLLIPQALGPTVPHPDNYEVSGAEQRLRGVPKSNSHIRRPQTSVRQMEAVGLQSKFQRSTAHGKSETATASTS
jgi:hypothetical protein